MAGVGPLGLSVTCELPPTPIDVLIDFSTPAGTMSVLPACVKRKIPLVLATTGHAPEDRAAIAKAGLEIPILYVPNTSLAVNVLMILVRRAAELLRNRDFDIEILERHHRFKKDAPSGTALHLAKIIQEELGEMELAHGREGLRGERPSGEIGIHAIRVGDNVGEHTVVFSTLGETLELTHRAPRPRLLRPRGGAGRQVSRGQGAGALYDGGCAGVEWITNGPGGKRKIGPDLGMTVSFIWFVSQAGERSEPGERNGWRSDARWESRVAKAIATMACCQRSPGGAGKASGERSRPWLKSPANESRFPGPETFAGKTGSRVTTEFTV